MIEEPSIIKIGFEITNTNTYINTNKFNDNNKSLLSEKFKSKVKTMEIILFKNVKLFRFPDKN